MNRQMPISLIVAETAIAFVILYLAIRLVQDIQYVLSSGKSGIPYTAITILNLGWSVAAFLGIPLRCRPTWFLARIASALMGTLAAFSGLLSLLLFTFSSKHGSFFMWPMFWSFFSAIYLFLIYYLVSCPSAAGFLGDADQTGTRRRRSQLGIPLLVLFVVAGLFVIPVAVLFLSDLFWHKLLEWLGLL